MKLQNSYIFLKNQYTNDKKTNSSIQAGKKVLSFEKDLYRYIEEIFPTAAINDEYRHLFKCEYVVSLTVENATCEGTFVTTKVIDTMYLDVVIEGKNKLQIVKCLEYVHNKFFTSDICRKYIPIISYDAISEHYCNRIYPKLNTLERNLRKLLFNIYVVNFGQDYYRVTIDEELQRKIKGVINADSKAEKAHIKEDYKLGSNKDVEEITRLQRFFYSFEYCDIQKLLFTPGWTDVDEMEKNKFLDEHKDLSKLSDENLREAFSKYVPKSDWERFFSNKVNISDIQDLIEQIRVYRNRVAHFKFFYKEDYDMCNMVVNRLNIAIVQAIRITEEKDFVEKNYETLIKVMKSISPVLDSFKKHFLEISQKVVDSTITSALFAVSKRIQEADWMKSLGNIAIRTPVEDVMREKLKLYDSIGKIDIMKSQIENTELNSVPSQDENATTSEDDDIK